ncbi:hypothetical protein [Luteococcus peritonei]|uniref:XRE family transcriptional regulator n=1 Tax=Luteococcus peritonei TaxID=88874 RepID=A0ABW4RQU1_9ACTN
MGTPPAPDPSKPEDFASIFSEAVARQDLTLTRLQARLQAAGTPVSSATLSYWQTGRSLPTRARSRKALLELEKILQLPPGRLIGALPGDAFTRWDPHSVMPDDETVTQALASMGLDLERRFTGVISLDEVVIAPNRAERSVLLQRLLRSEEDGWSRFPIVSRQDTELAQAPSVQALTGCLLGQVVQVPSARLVVAEMLLPRKLRRGAQQFVSYRIDSTPSQETQPFFERSLPNLHRTQVATIIFEGEPPRRATRYLRTSQDDPRGTIREHGPLPGSPVPVDGKQVQVVLSDAVTGIHGVAWQW